MDGSIELQKITRREILKYTAKIGAVGTATVATAAIVGGEIVHERELAKVGFFETEEARWHPIYERHDEHMQKLTPENIPPNLDVLSLEIVTNSSPWIEEKKKDVKDNYLFHARPELLLLAHIRRHFNDSGSTGLMIPSESLEHLKQNNILVAFGDVKYTDDRNSYRWRLESALQTREKIGSILLKAGLGVASGGQVLKTKRIDRRGFLRLAGAVAGTVGAIAYLPVRYEDELYDKLMTALKEDSPQQRLWARLYTIKANLMPEELNGLLRELIQANKLMTVAMSINNQRHNTSSKAEIGYNWHLAHRGIEDWLRLDQEVLRACILAFPDDILIQVVRSNENDQRALYATRLVQVPQSLKIEDYDNTSITYSVNDNEKVGDDIIEDTVLAKLLRKREIGG